MGYNKLFAIAMLLVGCGGSGLTTDPLFRTPEDTTGGSSAGSGGSSNTDTSGGNTGTASGGSSSNSGGSGNHEARPDAASADGGSGEAGFGMDAGNPNQTDSGTSDAGNPTCKQNGKSCWVSSNVPGICHNNDCIPTNPCGSANQACCPMSNKDRCSTNAVCVDEFCAECGKKDAPCCVVTGQTGPNAACGFQFPNSAITMGCYNGVCDCGKKGQVCCFDGPDLSKDGKCDGDLSCIGSRCL